ncbi:MAG: hypothetical protein KC708_24565, partial [Anaerolineae bacterium]|nr:hypothetical protein [Anaerolineae bacterium]
PFIAGWQREPMLREEEILNNIAMRMRIPYVTSKNKFLWIALSVGVGLLMGSFFIGFLRVFLYGIGEGLSGGIRHNASALSSLILLAPLVFFAVGTWRSFQYAHYLFKLKITPGLIRQIYDSMVEQRNIIGGTIEYVGDRYSYNVIRYKIDGSKITYRYQPHGKHYILASSGRIYVLYLNDRIHIPL